MNEKLLKSLFGNIICFDNNKYKNHVEAIKNNNYQVIELKDYKAEITDLFNYYKNVRSIINTSNKLNNSNIKVSVCFFHIDILQDNFLDYMFYESDYELIVMYNFLNSLVDLFEDNFVFKLNQPTHDFKNFNNEYCDDLLDDLLEEVILNILYEDSLGNVSLAGYSIEFLFNTVIIDNVPLDQLKTFLKFKKF
jgi:hypothetical protein